MSDYPEYLKDEVVFSECENCSNEMMVGDEGYFFDDYHFCCIECAIEYAQIEKVTLGE